MHVPELRHCAWAVALLFVAGCAGNPSAPPSGSPSGTLPAVVSRTAATTSSSLSSCSLTATAQGIGNGGVLQADPISPTDMWFVQRMSNGGYGVARYNPGGAPTTVLQPFGSTPVFSVTIAALADNDIWAVANRSGLPLPTYAIAHWNGSSWKQVSLTTPYPVFNPSTLSGLSTNDVWMSGTVLEPVSGGYPRGHAALAHWNGKTFSVVGVSPYENTGGPVVEISPTDVWLTAYNPVDTLAAQWNGSRFAFNILPAPPGQSNATTAPIQIAATGPDNIWIIGEHSTSTTDDGRIWRYNANWQPYLYTSATGNVTNFTGVAPFDPTRTVITAEGQSINQGTIVTYGYWGSGRFTSIPNNVPEIPGGPDAVIPGTSSFWMPNSNVVDLVSCK